jgi:hypothetical protein
MSERTHAEQVRRATVVAAWVAANGWVCPGWARDAHPALDLEACHVRPRYSYPDDGPLMVMCHACNVRQRYMPNRKGGA